MKKHLIIILSAILAACGGGNKPAAEQPGRQVEATENFAPQTEAAQTSSPQPALSRSAQMLDSLGYVNIAELDSEIAIDIVYATADNFTGEVLYDDLTEAYLLPEAAEKLLAAQKLLKERHPDYTFIVYDAARPFSAQKTMWEIAVRTGNTYYVANPAKGGGLHNYGAAVDISILDANGLPLPMGTAFDFFGEEANTDKEEALVARGKISQEELDNRLLLRGIMRQAGFTSIKSEWWHFNHCSREEARKRYPLIDF